MERKILVVDDEKPIGEMFAQAFSRAGFEVTTAESGEEALEIIRNTPFFICFLDLNLPGMNGVELCRQIRKQYPMAIPIAVTGFGSHFELADCRGAGFEDYFTKPARLSKLVKAAEYAFEKLERWEKG